MKVQSLVEALRKQGKADAAPNDRGNTVIRSFMPSSRYVVDFAEDFTAEGWLQFDTDQDAHYFGVWVNPTKMLTLSYAEGDWTLVICPSVTAYNAEIEDCCRFYGEGKVATVIDMRERSTTVYRQDRAAFFINIEVP